MNITIDIGNSSCMICGFNGKKIISSRKIPIVNLNEKKISNALKAFNKKKVKIIISSVVPNIETQFIRYLKEYNLDFSSIKDLRKQIDIKTNIINKKEIGDDRIVNIFYAKELYEKSVIVVDFGTATTFDILNQKGIYDGGIITPGIDLSLKALNDNTAKLPLVKFRKTKKIVGLSTEQAIESGFFWGYISMVQGLINKIEIEQRDKFRIILTGGNANYFKKIFKNVLSVDEFFTSKALNNFINWEKK